MTISIIDIKRSILQKLGELYPDHTCYAEKVPQGFQKPSFFLYFVPAETTHESKFYYATSIMAKIDYYANQPSNETNWLMGEALTKAFQQGLVVNGNHLDITKTNQEMVDEELVFTVHLTYHNGIDMLTIQNEEGHTEFVQENKRLGYTDGSIELMQELDWKEE